MADFPFLPERRSLAPIDPNVPPNAAGRVDRIAPPPQPKPTGYGGDTMRELQSSGLKFRLSPEQWNAANRGVMSARGTEAFDNALANAHAMAAENATPLPQSRAPAVGGQNFQFRGAPQSGAAPYDGMPRFQMPATVGDAPTPYRSNLPAHGAQNFTLHGNPQDVPIGDGIVYEGPAHYGVPKAPGTGFRTGPGNGIGGGNGSAGFPRGGAEVANDGIKLLTGPKPLPPGFIDDLGSVARGFNGAVEGAGRGVAQLMNSPLINNPFMRTVGRIAGPVGAALGAYNAVDQLADPNGASHRRFAASGRDAMAGNVGSAAKNAYYGVGDVVGDFTGLRPFARWLAGADRAPPPDTSKITYNDETHEFSRAPRNMDDYRQMEQARQDAQAGLPKLHALTTNGREVALTPSEVNATRGIKYEGDASGEGKGSMRDALLKNGYITDPNTDLGTGGPGGAGGRSDGVLDGLPTFGGAASGGRREPPMTAQQKYDRYIMSQPSSKLDAGGYARRAQLEIDRLRPERQDRNRELSENYATNHPAERGSDKVLSNMGHLLTGTGSLEHSRAQASTEQQRADANTMQAKAQVQNALANILNANSAAETARRPRQFSPEQIAAGQLWLDKLAQAKALKQRPGADLAAIDADVMDTFQKIFRTKNANQHNFSEADLQMLEQAYTNARK